MLFITQILVRTLVLGASAVALVACGQQGPLYLPQADGAHRASLPESLSPALGTPRPSLQPASPASAPAHP